MSTRKQQRQIPIRSVERMAVAAIEGSRRPVDLLVGRVNPSPGALDLPEQEHQETCSRCGRPALDTCPECGNPIRRVPEPEQVG